LLKYHQLTTQTEQKHTNKKQNIKNQLT